MGLTKARKLVERDKVHMMAGALLSSTGYALAPYIDAMRIPMVYPVVSADDLTQRRRSKWIVRTGWTGSQPNHAFGEYAYHTLKLQEGRDDRARLRVRLGVGRRIRADVRGGGRHASTQKIWCPVSVHDFAPYLAQVSRDVDAVYALFLGRAALQFMRQYQEFGLKRRMPLIGGGTTTDEHVLPFMGDEALGVITALHYSAALDTPANRKFAAAYRARYKKVPSYYSESMYTRRQVARRGHRGACTAASRTRRRSRRAPAGQGRRPAARTGGARRVRQPDRERLHPAGRAGERRAAEHRDRDLPATCRSSGNTIRPST